VACQRFDPARGPTMPEVEGVVATSVRVRCRRPPVSGHGIDRAIPSTSANLLRSSSPTSMILRSRTSAAVRGANRMIGDERGIVVPACTYRPLADLVDQTLGSSENLEAYGGSTAPGADAPAGFADLETRMASSRRCQGGSQVDLTRAGTKSGRYSGRRSTRRAVTPST
jgi:hypothetical protein